jgi:hypothetical protein
VAFELSGEASSDYRLCVEAGFLASPIIREIGKRVVLSGPTGREPLVGLRMNLELANRDLARKGNRGSPSRSLPLPPATPHQSAEPPALASAPRFSSRPKEGGPPSGEPMVEPSKNRELANDDLASEASRASSVQSQPSSATARQSAEAASSNRASEASAGFAPPSQPSSPTVHQCTEPPALASRVRVFRSRIEEGEPAGEEPPVEPRMEMEVANSDRASEAGGGSAPPSQPTPATVHQPAEPPALASRPRVFHSRPKEGAPTGGEPLVESRRDAKVANSDLASEASGGSASPLQPSPPTAHQFTDPLAFASRVRVFHSRPKGGGPTSDGA